MKPRMRYSGELIVSLVLRGERYRCTVTHGIEGERYTCTVGTPHVLTQAIDSPDAFDEAARAAISFAADEVGMEGAALTDAGVHVSRSADRAWA